MPTDNNGACPDSLAVHFELFAEFYPEAVLLLGTDGRIRATNPAFVDVVGLSAGGVIGAAHDFWVEPADRPAVVTEFVRSLNGETRRFRCGASISHGSGPVEVTYSPVRGSAVITGVLAHIVPIAYLERREPEKDAASQLLRVAGELVGFGGWSLEADTLALGLSDEARSILGIDRSASLDLSEISGLIDPTDLRALRHSVRTCVTRSTPVDLAIRVTTPSGDPKVLRILGYAVDRQPGSDKTRIYGAIWDNTEQAAASKREATLTQRLDATLNSLSDGLVFLDEHWRIVLANSQAVALFGLPLSALEGRSLWHSFPELAHSELPTLHGATASENVRTTIRTFSARSGRWLDVTAHQTAHGTALHFRDVTGVELTRQSGERAVQQIAEQAALIGAARDAMVVRGVDGVVQLWNRAAEEIYGVSAEEAIGTSIRQLIEVPDALYESALTDTVRDGHWAEEITIRTRDGRELIVDCRWQLLSGDGVSADRIFSVESDVTEWRRAENRRERATRMESLGTFAGGIAHDLNNVLTPILMGIDMLELAEVDPENRELLATMESAARRGADMVRQVLSFGRGVDGRRDRVDVAALLGEVRRFTRDALPSSIEVVIEIDDDVADVLGDHTQLMQVMTNLITNARDAMASGGVLEVVASMLVLEDTLSSDSFPPRPGRFVLIDVIDSGQGMSSDIKGRIFEPFFTTKAVGRGTGLGLASSLAIIRSHGGTIRVYSEEDHGTRFSIILPALDAAADPATSRTERRPLPRGRGERILVVDDDETIRDLALTVLHTHGYRTTAARDGSEALAILERDGASIDLILTDIVMPGMSGPALASSVMRVGYGIPVILSSGFASPPRPAGDAMARPARVLPKPYTTRALLTTLREELDGGNRRRNDGDNGAMSTRGREST